MSIHSFSGFTLQGNRFASLASQPGSHQSSRASTPNPGANEVWLNSPAQLPNTLAEMVDDQEHEPQQQQPQQAPTQEQALLSMIDTAIQNAVAPLQQQLAAREAEIEELRKYTKTQVEGMRNAYDGIEIRTRTMNSSVDALIAAGSGRQTLSVKVQPPEHYNGDRASFRSWLSQLNLFFSLSRNTITNDRERVLYACSCIKGPAYAHVQATVDSAVSGTPAAELDDYGAFISRINLVFGPPDQALEAQRALRALRQKKDWTVDHYASEFKRWMIFSGWNESALLFQFKEGLLSDIRIALASVFPQPTTVDEFIKLASQVDGALRIAGGRSSSMTTQSSASLSTSAASNSNDPSAMDLDRMRIGELQRKTPKAEWDRRMAKGCCLNCGRDTHRLSKCRSRFYPTPPPAAKAAMASIPDSASAPPAPSPPTPAPNPLQGMSAEAINSMVSFMQGYVQSQAAKSSSDSSQPSGF